MMKQGLLLAVKLCLLHVCSCVCPRTWPLPDVINCLYNITNGVNGTNVLVGTDTETIRMFCENGTFNRSVECLENLYTECGKKMIVPFAEPSEWRHAVVTLCGNLQDHAVHSTCIVGMRSEVKQCLHRNDMMFQERMARQGSWNALKMKICSYYEGIKICTSEPVKRNCNAQIGRTLGNFISSLIPKICLSDYFIINNTSTSQSYKIKIIPFLLISLPSFLFYKTTSFS